MVFRCYKCNFFSNGNKYSIANHRRSCKGTKLKNLLSITNHELEEFNVKPSNASEKIMVSKMKEKTNNSINNFNNNLSHSAPGSFLEDECNDINQIDHFSPHSPLDNFPNNDLFPGDIEDDSSTALDENKYIHFQRKILKLRAVTRSTTIGEVINSPLNSGLLNNLKLGHTEPIIPWDQHESSRMKSLGLDGESIISSIKPNSSLYYTLTSRTSNSSSLQGFHQRRVERGSPNPIDVLDIFMYCQKHILSVNDGNGLLFIIHQLFARHPPMENFFLHKNMKSINSSLTRAVDGLYTSYDIHIPIHSKLTGQDEAETVQVNRLLNPHGDTNPNLVIATGIGLDVMEIISETLISHDFNDFSFTPNLDIRNGQRCYSTFITADLFKSIFDRVQLIYGEDVYPFCFQWAFDSTPISGGGCGTKNITPLNIRSLQFKDHSIFRSITNCTLIGFFPCFTVSNKFYELYTLLFLYNIIFIIFLLFFILFFC